MSKYYKGIVFLEGKWDQAVKSCQYDAFVLGDVAAPLLNKEGATQKLAGIVTLPACVVFFPMDKRLVDAKGKTIGFVKGSGVGKIVTDANGAIKGRYEAHNDKTFTATGAYSLALATSY